MADERAPRLTVFLDFDNTLMDNDAVGERLHRLLAAELGERATSRFWKTYERVRAETGIVDVPESVRRFAFEGESPVPPSHLLAMFFDTPFADLVYADARRAIAHLDQFALPVVLSDGDQVYQPHKIRSSGIHDLVAGRVRVYAHKEEHARELVSDFPAEHYVMVDDKPRIHAAMREAFGSRITTVMVCQGKYARGPGHDDFPEADITLQGIGELCRLDAEALAGAADLAERRSGGRSPRGVHSPVETPSRSAPPDD